MIKFLKNINWDAVANVTTLVIATVIGTMLFAFGFVFAKAIIEAIF